MNHLALSILLLAAAPTTPTERDAPEPVQPGNACATPERPWTGFDQSSYRLVRDSNGYRLEGPDGSGVEVPREWLAPPEIAAREENHYVTSLAWDETVTAFPIGYGRTGLHLSSYAIQSEGSASAAAGRDLFLILSSSTDIDSGRLVRGLDLGETKGRVRIGGCFSAYFQRLFAGDIDCDRRLDLAAMEERIHCDGDLEGPAEQIYTVGPLQWYLQEGDAWTSRPELDGRFPCGGLQQVPLIGLVQGPVEMLLDWSAMRDPLLPLPHER